MSHDDKDAARVIDAAAEIELLRVQVRQADERGDAAMHRVYVAEAQVADMLMVLRMVDDNHRVAAGEKRKAWNGRFVVDEVRRFLTGTPLLALPEGHEPMPATWWVEVSADGEQVLWISSNAVTGNMDGREHVVIGAARHLLAFVGYGLPASEFDPEGSEGEAA